MTANFEIIKKDEKFFFRLSSSSGRSLLHSDGYTTEDRCRLVIDIVKINAQSSTRFEINASDIGRSYFLLRSGNGQILAMSDFVKSRVECEEMIMAVQSEASSAEVTVS